MISKLMLVLAVAGLLVAFLVCMVMGSMVNLFLPNSGVTVTIYNTTDRTVTGVQVETTGSTQMFTEVAAGGNVTFVANPSADSHIVLRFTDPDGNQQEQEIGVYMERGYSGSVDIYIRPGWTVDWVDKIEI